MLFSSLSFLYYFLPLLFIVYFAVPSQFKNLVLFSFSLGFYFFGEPSYTLLLIAASLSGYLHGRLIDYSKDKKYKKLWLTSSIVIGLSLLLFFKYFNFFVDNINTIVGLELRYLTLVLPLGISFYTFQILSYTIDVYRREVEVQKNALDFMTYVALFPQLIAGPIVRYHTVEKALSSRRTTPKDVKIGTRRFLIGLGKKVLIANTLAEIGLHFQTAQSHTVVFYWLYAIAFTLQVYYDFSGYSDMAIGLGRILGFNFLENFNYPYIAKSITEFWRRWHISLGQWFKRYVYIPLGGNRVKLKRLIFNIGVVWFLTGFWHGAAWNFIVWGLYYAVLLLIEKLLLKDRLKTLPTWLRHAYVIILTVLGMTIFNADSLSEGIDNLFGMFFFNQVPFINHETSYYLSSYLNVIIIAIIGATPIIKNLVTKFSKIPHLKKLPDILEPVLAILLLLLVTASLIDGSFNPFIYFRF